MARKLILKGKYGRLTVLHPTTKRAPGGGIIWKFRCDCGNITEHLATHVRRGSATSCGCSRKSDDEKKSLIIAKYSDYKHNAKKRGIEFQLSIEEFSRVTDNICHYCGARETVSRKQFRAELCGIDRIDNHKGYIKDNVLPCCSKCNYAKRQMEYNEFMLWIHRLVEHYSPTA